MTRPCALLLGSRHQEYARKKISTMFIAVFTAFAVFKGVLSVQQIFQPPFRVRAVPANL